MAALDPSDLQAIWLTLKLASVTTVLLLIIVTPLAWWLAHSRKWYKGPVAAVVALPLVLPPSVLGFYLLLLLGPHGAVGKLTSALNLGTLPFTFSGLVVGSVLFSMPFAVQPIQNAFEAMGKRPLEVAATLRAGAWDRFLTVALPLARPGFITATILAFAHTVGEFGVVLMLGGNIQGETRVLSVAIYNHVEAIEYGAAHWLAGGMVLFSFLVLLALYLAGGKHWRMAQMTWIRVHLQMQLDSFMLDAKFSAPPLGVTALFGPSGSGKTTLLRCIAGLERATGWLRVNGEPWQDEKTFVPVHRRPLGYVFQEASLFPHLSVRANLEYGLKRTPAARTPGATGTGGGMAGAEPSHRTCEIRRNYPAESASASPSVVPCSPARASC